MSLILDALRRRSADRGGDDSPDGTARADAVPAPAMMLVATASAPTPKLTAEPIATSV